MRLWLLLLSVCLFAQGNSVDSLVGNWNMEDSPTGSVTKAVPGTSAAPSANLVGRWRSLESSSGGIGALFGFHEDGSLDFSSGAVVELPYRLDRDILSLPPDEKDSATKNRVKFVDENHVQLICEVQGKTHIQELRRHGSAPDTKNPILGEWTSKREDLGRDVEATEIFYPTGKCLTLIPFIWQHGRYIITDDTIRLEVPNRTTTQGQFKLEGDTLTLPRPHGGADRFARY
jgi:hypothetical protein